ncbi:MAG: ATP-binding protein [Candidatus Omnitrophota bacterium]
MKDKIIKIFVIGVVLVVLFIEAGLLVSIFASKEFTTVIFSSALVAVLSLGAVCLITFPLFDRILSPMTVLVKKVKGYCGEGHIEEEKGEIAYIDHACSQMISSLGSFSQSNSFLQKFQEILSSGVTTSDLLEAARNGLRSIQYIDSAALLLISGDKKKATIYPLFPEGLAERRDIPLDEEGTSIREIRLKEAVFKKSLLGGKKFEEVEKIFFQQGSRGVILVPIEYRGAFFGVIGAAAKRDEMLLKGAIRLIQSITGLIALKAAHLRVTDELRVKEDRLIEYKQVDRGKAKDQMDELRQTYNQVVQSSKMASLGQLSAGVAHELNNPIGGILGYVQLILSRLKSSTPSQDVIDTSIRYLEMVEKESKRCQWIISNLLNFSRKSSEEMEEINIQDVIENTVSMMEFQLSQKNMKVSAAFSPEGLRKINGNANQLQQVFTNLIQNAQDAMGENGVIKVTALNKSDTRYRPPLEYVEVRVSDSGSGISKENLANIFDPFFTSKVGRSGTGLGLSITHTIVQAHRGTVAAESEEGKGTTFILSFPIVKSKEPKK